MKFRSFTWLVLLVSALVLSISQFVLPDFALATVVTADQGGFLLPFSGTATLSQNLHDRSSPGSQNGALDFIKGSSRFDILAPKDGEVIYAFDDVPDDYGGDCSTAFKAMNYVVLGHGPKKTDGTYPFYTVYMHLSWDSIPTALHASGARVRVGQVIGRAGNTGHFISQNSGSDAGVHLHFFGTVTKPTQSSQWIARCDGSGGYMRAYALSYSFANTRPVGFEEMGNQWPLLGSQTATGTVPPAPLTSSYNSTAFETNDCNPNNSNVKVILYEHRDFGGECYQITDSTVTTNVPSDLGPSGLNVSSIYLNPSYFNVSNHILHLYKAYNAGGETMEILASANTLGTWNDLTKSLHNSAALPSWLTTKSFAEDLPFETDIHVVVTDQGDFDAMRVCFNGENCQETGATELYYTWNTYGWTDGSYVISIQYRVESDNGNWANAEKADFAYSLSPIREAYAPCGSSVDGIELTSGSDCIIVVHDVGDLAPVGWADRSNLQACVSGENLIGWLHDGVRDQFGNFPGTPHVINDGSCKSVGGNVSSVQFRTTQDIPPVPSQPFAVDSDTVHLYHFDEGSGSSVSDAAGSLSGSINSSNWVSGRFGSSLSFPNPNDGRAVTFGTMDVCPITVELWVKSGTTSGHWRVAGQLGGNGNSGSNKWLLALDGMKPKFEIWSGGGSISTTSYRDLPDNDWHYLMATYDCSTKQALLYLDNEVVGNFTSASTWNSGATTLEIGAGEGIYKCNCSIDEVRISNVVRVPELPAPPEPTPTPTLTATNTFTPTFTPTMTPAYSNTNLVSNGGFESVDGSSWAVDWTNTQSSVSVDTNAQGNDQMNSLHFAYNAVDAHARSLKFAINPADVYVWSTFVKTGTGTGEFGFYIDEYDATDTWVSGQWMGNLLVGDFQTWAMFYYVPSSSTVAKVSLQLFSVGGTTFDVFVDSVQFQSTSQPTATPLASYTPTATATFTPTATPSITNLVVNGGFESLTSSWANNWVNSQSSVSIDTTTQGNEGTNTLHFVPNTVPANAVSDKFAVSIANQYTWNFYLKTTSGNGELGFYIDEYDSSQAWISGQWINAVYGETNGTQTFPYTPSSGSVAYASLQYYMSANTTFDGYVDSVVFYQSGLASTPTPTLTFTPTLTPTATLTLSPTFTPTATVQPPTNLVQNAGFESLTSGWANNWTASASSVTIDTSSNGNAGTNSLHFSPNTSNTNAVSDKFAVSSLASYVWSFYLSVTSGTGEFGFYIDEYDASQVWISGQWIDAVYTSGAAGVQYPYTPTNSSVAYASVQYYMAANSTFDAYVDSVSVVQN